MTEVRLQLWLTGGGVHAYRDCPLITGQVTSTLLDHERVTCCDCLLRALHVDAGQVRRAFDRLAQEPYERMAFDHLQVSHAAFERLRAAGEAAHDGVRRGERAYQRAIKRKYRERAASAA